MKRSKLFETRVLLVTQPIGQFYVTAIDATLVANIARADVRRLDVAGSAIEQYLGIQRKLDLGRRKEIEQFVKTRDATFPTSVVLAIGDERSIELSSDGTTLTFFEVFADEDGPAIPEGEIASILDGQHRLAGLKDASATDFGLPVTIFPKLDIALQAYIFSTVNLAQTKVNRSLVYDLYAYAESRSPQKTCHEIAVNLNDLDGSPFHDRIKRLGSATPGIVGETLTQATFVQKLLPYLSRDPVADQDALRRNHKISRVAAIQEFRLTPFRNLFIAERDEVITNIVWDYFDAVRQRWSNAWRKSAKGEMLTRTNGFRAFMNVLGEMYVMLGGNDGYQPASADYKAVLDRSSLEDHEFTTDIFLPGSSGEKLLTEKLRSAIARHRTNPSIGKNP